MLEKKRFLAGILIVFIFCFFYPSHSLAGKLDDFEEEATQEKKSPKKEKKPPSPEKPKRDTEMVIFRATSGCDSFSDCLFSFFFDLTVGGLYEGGKSSLNQKLYNESITGTPVLPIVSIDSNYQNIETEVYSINNRL